MAPEIIDLVTSEEENNALEPLQPTLSRGEAAATRIHAGFQSLRPPLTPQRPNPKAERITPKRTTSPDSFSHSHRETSTLSTPARNDGRVQGSSDNIPISLKKKKDCEEKDLVLTSPLLKSPSVGNTSAVDSGIGESVSGTEKSTQDHATGGKSGHQSPMSVPGNGATAEIRFRRMPSSQAEAHGVDVIMIDDSEALSRPSDDSLSRSLTPSKRKRSSTEPDKETILVVPSMEMLCPQKGLFLQSISNAKGFVSPANPGTARSIMPHIPGSDIQSSKVRSETPMPRPNAESVVQESGQTGIIRREKRRQLSEGITRESGPHGPFTFRGYSNDPGKGDEPTNNQLRENESKAYLHIRLPEVAPSDKVLSTGARQFDKRLSVNLEQGAESWTPEPEQSVSRKLNISEPRVVGRSHEDLGVCPPEPSTGEPRRTPYEYPVSHELKSPSIFGNEGEMEMEFELFTGAAFPPNYDRGRFPALRRRRGGKKYGTYSVSGFRKVPSHPDSYRRSNSTFTRRRAVSSASIKFSSGLTRLGEHSDAGDAAASVPSTSPQDLTTSKFSDHGDSIAGSERVKTLVSNTLTGTVGVDGAEAMSSEEVVKVKQFFISVLYPAIKRQKKYYEIHLSEEELLNVEKSIANDAVNDGLVDFLRRNGFDIDRHQRKKIRKHISLMYLNKISAAERMEPDHAAEMPWGLFEKKPAPSTPSGAIPEPSHQLCKGRGPLTRPRKTTTIETINGSGGGPPQPSYFGGLYGLNESAGPASKNKQPVNDATTMWCDKKTPNVAIHPTNSISPPWRNLESESLKEEDLAISGLQADALAIPGTRDTSRSRSSVSEPPTGGPTAQGPSRLMGQRCPTNTGLIQPPRAKANNNTSSFLPRAKIRVTPPTYFNPHLENIIAEAALRAHLVGNLTVKSSSDRITRDDQVQLLEQEYIPKSLLRPRDSGPDKARTQLITVVGRMTDPALRPERQISALLRRRELGSGIRTNVRSELRLRVAESLEPWRKWKGASSDIVTVAWAPDSSSYAVGAAAHTNAEDLQYNRPCNLLYGELTLNKLWELPDHRNQRPKPESFPQGPNSIQETYNTCDPMIYQTVNSVAFSIDGSQMYTASRDKTVKVWDTTGNKPTCLQTIKHEAIVSGVDVCRTCVGVFATASQHITGSIRVYHRTEDGTAKQSPMVLSSSRAEARPGLKIFPECIRWGTSAHTGHYLLAGFMQWENTRRGDCAQEGQLCLWDVDTHQSIRVARSSQSVTAAVWHPFLPFFATGGAPGGGILSTRRTKTVVRTWDLRNTTSFAMEYESPALDIQDVTFHPLDSNIVTAGCTDGSSFVWDFRWPDQPLHQLRHGRALMELDHQRSRAEADTGVCLSLWGPEGALYYSGSSDGVIKVWDIRRHPADVHIKDVAQVGAAVQNGAFSPDFAHMLVGDSDGGIHILSSAPYGRRLSENTDDHRIIEEPITFIRAPDGSKRLDPMDDNPGTEGIMVANELVESGQLEIHPVFGVGKGVNYQGPWSKDKREEGKDDCIGPLREHYDRQQLFDSKGNLNEAEIAKRSAFAAMRRSLLEKGRERETDKSIPSDGLDTTTATEGLSLLPTGFTSLSSHVPANGEQLEAINKAVPHLDAEPLVKAENSPQVAAHREDSKLREELGRYRHPAHGFEEDNIRTVVKPKNVHHSTSKWDQVGTEDNLTPESEMVEEDFWWPWMGEDEITRALASTNKC
ncbi:MAG: hypothetical protein Q9163_001319 [Psora crenata]